MLPSNYQTNIWDFIENGEGNAVVNSVAGSGKTTTLVEGLKRTKKDIDVSFLAFNKGIAEELKNKVDSHHHVGTFHSLGMHSLMKSFGRVKLNKNKVKNIIFSKLSTFNVPEKEKGAFAYKVGRMVDLVRFFNLKPNHENYLDLGLQYGLNLSENEIEATIKILNLSNNSIRKEIDFTDMIYQPVKLDLKLPKYDMVFVDEGQDLSIIQQELFKKILKRNGRFIAVGDPFQAIYGFAGSDANSFKKLTEMDNVKQFPLSVCYRCDKAIINKAKEIVPHIEFFEGNGLGTVRNGLIREVKMGDMVLCRNNKPLFKLCLAFFKENKKATIKGREFGSELITIIEQTKHKNKLVSTVRLDSVLNKHFDKLYSLGISKPERTNSYRQFEEKIDIIKNVIYPEISNTDDAVKLIQRIFNEKEGTKRINLSTIHKAKGLESDNVFVLDKELMPSKFANTPEEIQQEKNLEYVCYTRAKKKLIFLTDSETIEDE